MFPQHDTHELGGYLLDIDGFSLGDVEFADIPNAGEGHFGHFRREGFQQVDQHDGGAIQVDFPLHVHVIYPFLIYLDYQVHYKVHNICFELRLLSQYHIITFPQVVSQYWHHELQVLKIIACLDVRQYFFLKLGKWRVLDLAPLLGWNADNEIDQGLVVEPAGRRNFVDFLQMDPEQEHHVFEIVIRFIGEKEGTDIHNTGFDLHPDLGFQRRFNNLSHCFDAP